MPIDAQWANDDRTIIHIHCPTVWTWDDYDLFDDNLHAMLDSVDTPVVAVVDTRGTRIPADVFSHFPRLRDGAVASHPGLTVNVIIVFNRLLLTLLQSFLRLYRLEQPKHVMVTTREEAEELANSYAY